MAKVPLRVPAEQIVETRLELFRALATHTDAIADLRALGWRRDRSLPRFPVEEYAADDYGPNAGLEWLPRWRLPLEWGWWMVLYADLACDRWEHTAHPLPAPALDLGRTRVCRPTREPGARCRVAHCSCAAAAKDDLVALERVLVPAELLELELTRSWDARALQRELRQLARQHLRVTLPAIDEGGSSTVAGEFAQARWRTYQHALRARRIATSRPRELQRDCAWLVRFHVNRETEAAIRPPHRGDRPNGAVTQAIVRVAERLGFDREDLKRLRRHTESLKCPRQGGSPCHFPECFWHAVLRAYDATEVTPLDDNWIESACVTENSVVVRGHIGIEPY